MTELLRWMLFATVGTLLAWLIGVFVWHGVRLCMKWAMWQMLCLIGQAHRYPVPHKADWDESETHSVRCGPVFNWYRLNVRYGNREYQACRHPGCRGRKIVRMYWDDT